MNSYSHNSLSILNKPFTVMGIINVTPDSFYDGGLCLDPENALRRSEQMVQQGADILDIGGESTRPGALAVDEKQECQRVLPVISAIAKRLNIPISIDTTKSSIARMALDAGATWINDISAGRFDPAMASVAAKYRCPVVLMHSRNTPQTMQIAPHYHNVIEEIRLELSSCIERFINEGVRRENIIIDPGIGFAKRFEDNVQIIKNIDAFISMGFPLLLGASRKSFIGQITGKPVQQRLAGSLACIAAAFAKGVKFFRVHDVAETVDFLKVLTSFESNSGV